MFFRDVTLRVADKYQHFGGARKDGGSRFLQNISTHLPHYMAPHSKNSTILVTSCLRQGKKGRKKYFNTKFIIKRNAKLNIPYFLDYKTHFFSPQKCDLKSTCVLYAEGKYLFPNL